MKNIFKSDRLVFLPVDKDERLDKFWDKMANRPRELNSNGGLPVGYTREQSAKWREDAQKDCLLLKYACLPPEEPPTAEPTAEPTTEPTEPRPEPQPEPVGIITLSRLPARQAHHSRAYIGVDVAPGLEGRGYGSEMIRWALWWAFTMAGLHRVEIGCFGWNKGALRLYRRLGFTLEGTSREAVWFMGGWHDTYELGMLEREWRAMCEREGKGGDDAVAPDTDQVARIMGCE